MPGPELTHIADQLRRAFDGYAWHGDSLFEILAGVTAAQASARPVKGAHTIWELTLHIAAWDGVARRRMTGAAVKLSARSNFPPVTDTSKAAGEDLGETWARLTRNSSPRWRNFPRNLFIGKSPAKEARITPSITCSTASCSTSSITPIRLPC